MSVGKSANHPHLRIGLQVHEMSDAEILRVFNKTIAAQIRNSDELGEYVGKDPRHRPRRANAQFRRRPARAGELRSIARNT